MPNEAKGGMPDLIVKLKQWNQKHWPNGSDWLWQIEARKFI